MKRFYTLHGRRQRTDSFNIKAIVCLVILIISAISELRPSHEKHPNSLFRSLLSAQRRIYRPPYNLDVLSACRPEMVTLETVGGEKGHSTIPLQTISVRNVCEHHIADSLEKVHHHKPKSALDWTGLSRDILTHCISPALEQPIGEKSPLPGVREAFQKAYNAFSQENDTFRFSTEWNQHIKRKMLAFNKVFLQEGSRFEFWDGERKALLLRILFLEDSESLQRKLAKLKARAFLDADNLQRESEGFEEESLLEDVEDPSLEAIGQLYFLKRELERRKAGSFLQDVDDPSLKAAWLLYFLEYERAHETTISGPEAHAIMAAAKDVFRAKKERAKGVIALARADLFSPETIQAFGRAVAINEKALFTATMDDRYRRYIMATLLEYGLVSSEAVGEFSQGVQENASTLFYGYYDYHNLAANQSHVRVITALLEGGLVTAEKIRNFSQAVEKEAQTLFRRRIDRAKVIRALAESGLTHPDKVKRFAQGIRENAPALFIGRVSNSLFSYNHDPDNEFVWSQQEDIEKERNKVRIIAALAKAGLEDPATIESFARSIQDYSYILFESQAKRADIIEALLEGGLVSPDQIKTFVQGLQKNVSRFFHIPSPHIIGGFARNGLTTPEKIGNFIRAVEENAATFFCAQAGTCREMIILKLLEKGMIGSEKITIFAQAVQENASFSSQIFNTDLVYDARLYLSQPDSKNLIASFLEGDLTCSCKISQFVQAVYAKKNMIATYLKLNENAERLRERAHFLYRKPAYSYNAHYALASTPQSAYVENEYRTFELRRTLERLQNEKITLYAELIARFAAAGITCPNQIEPFIQKLESKAFFP